MILMAVAARQANSQILAASSTREGSIEPIWLEFEALNGRDLEGWARSESKYTQKPIKLKSSHDNPPILVLMGDNAKVSAKTANASVGKVLRDKEMVSNRLTHFVI
jgi:hypothetical protein